MRAAIHVPDNFQAHPEQCSDWPAEALSGAQHDAFDQHDVAHQSTMPPAMIAAHSKGTKGM